MYILRGGRLMERVYPGVPLMIDHTQVDVLVKASRLLNDQTTNAAIRPWLTLCWEPDSRVVVFSLLSERNTDQKTVEAVICAVFSHTKKHHRSDVPQKTTVGNKTHNLTHQCHKIREEDSTTPE